MVVIYSKCFVGWDFAAYAAAGAGQLQELGISSSRETEGFFSGSVKNAFPVTKVPLSVLPFQVLFVLSYPVLLVFSDLV